MEAEVIINSKIFDVWKWIVGISVSAGLVAVGLITTAFNCHKKEIEKEQQYREFVKKKLYAGLSNKFQWNRSPIQSNRDQ
ncbi:hypothetical protein Q7C36_004388 [Tachysurus vachellii]|uniref:Uncharacterized protein n=1 Tax=Tachysurus vachellii TaxID=175792 RepID=A0AA88T3Z7_TACVA|nr:hypothetical protein Q7C36_004388 [Tachysurus vachellii]